MISIRRAIAAIAVAIAFAACTGTALAATFNVTTNGTYVEHPPTAVAIEQTRDQAFAPSVLRVTSDGGGFNWGDAIIGLAAGVAITVLVLRGGLAVAQRRSGHIRHA
jgi:hypothetical protein